MELNNRELALIFWIIIMVAWAFSKTQVRKHIPELISSALQFKLVIVYGIMAAYTAGIVYLLYRLGLWDSSQYKNTTLWFFTIGLVSLKDIMKSGQVNYFKNTVLNIIGLTSIFEFVINVYPFSFVAEFVLVPATALAAGVFVMAEKKPEFAPVRKLMNGLFISLLLYTIGFTIFKITSDIKSFANKGTLNDFFVPGALSFLFIPLVYILSLYSTRESVFISLKSAMNPKILQAAKWYTLLDFAFNKDDLQRWKKYIFLRKVETKEELRDSITFIKHLKEMEMKPAIVPSKSGWSPYRAKEVLVGEGIKTGYYQPTIEDDWSACSTYFEIDDDLIANNIVYYIEGTSFAAQKLQLVVNVNNPTNARSAIVKLADCANLLCRFALNEDVPETVINSLFSSKNIKLQIGNKYISVNKSYWQGHKLDGYNLDFTIGLIGAF